ncbi:MAG: hypothetical protein HUJ93_07830 [Bacteroidales bacterium]|nr:hypothetical protein [Bacteroidales bacterium]
MRFRKYNSIENHFDSDFMRRIAAEVPSGTIFVVQEKVHGTNTSFVCDGNEFKFAKRTAFIEDGESFYNHEELVDAYRDKVIQLSKDVMRSYPETIQVTVYGELFGGLYTSNEVKQNRSITQIQKGVCYTPEHEFYGFDIYISSEYSGRYLPVNEVNALFEKHGFFYARTLFEGRLEECLKYPNEFQSKISHWLGLPQIEGNICEGIVIRPLDTMFLANGSRVIIKSKNAKFAEKKSIKKRVKMFSGNIPYSDKLKELICEAECYVTDNRINNVISHIGEISLPKEFGKLIGLYAQDALADFLKEHGGDYAGLEKSEQKNLNRELNNLCVKKIKQYYSNQ